MVSLRADIFRIYVIQSVMTISFGHLGAAQHAVKSTLMC